MKGVAAVLLVILVARSAVASIGHHPCNVLSETLLLCTKFAAGQEPEPTKECRDGVRSFGQKLKSAEDKRNACKCLKLGVDAWPELVDVVTNLFKKCGAQLPFPVTKDMECDEIK